MQYKTYTATTIKTRNYLSNIAFNRVVRVDLCNRNSVFDIYVLLTKNLNSHSLGRKIADRTTKMIYMLWKECIPAVFYRFICQKENILYLNSKNVLHPKTFNKFWSFISQDGKNYNLLRDILFRFKDIFQYGYSIVYPDIYCSTKYRGIDLRSSFQLVFKEYRDKKGGATRERRMQFF